jgi:hypothetical protein
MGKKLPNDPCILGMRPRRSGRLAGFGPLIEKFRGRCTVEFLAGDVLVNVEQDASDLIFRSPFPIGEFKLVGNLKGKLPVGRLGTAF